MNAGQWSVLVGHVRQADVVELAALGRVIVDELNKRSAGSTCLGEVPIPYELTEKIYGQERIDDGF